MREKMLLMIGLILTNNVVSQGGAESYSQVINKVEGGEVYTRIETRVNGESQVLEASEAGEYKVEMKAGPETKAEEEKEIKEEVEAKEEKEASWLSKLIKEIKLFLLEIFT